jgi:sulfide dehydrogenase cytochrome subunit
MCAPAAHLAAADISTLADYYSDLPYVHTQQTLDPAKVAAGKAIAAKNCDGCHTKGGSDPADDAGILAGQPVGFLKSTLAAHKAGQVPQEEKMMKQKLATLSDADLDALAQYYASL